MIIKLFIPTIRERYVANNLWGNNELELEKAICAARSEWQYFLRNEDILQFWNWEEQERGNQVFPASLQDSICSFEPETAANDDIE